MSSTPIPIYFETSWSILSSIGLINVLIGFLVIGITSLSPITIVPIVVSAASAIADGLCYYAFYANHATTKTAVAAGFADFFWLVGINLLLTYRANLNSRSKKLDSPSIATRSSSGFFEGGSEPCSSAFIGY